MSNANPEAAEACRRIASISLDLASLWSQAAKAALDGNVDDFNAVLTSVVVKDVALFDAHSELARHWERTEAGERQP